MHIKIPFLAVLIITVFQLTLYGIQNNKYSSKDLDEILTVNLDNVTEVSITDLDGAERHTTNPKQIDAIVDYFNQFEYQRLMNDQTAFMPERTMTINYYVGKEMNFMIPYGKEAFIDHRVYSVKGGTIDQATLLEMFQSMPEDNHPDNSL